MSSIRVNSRMALGYLYPTRSSELPVIKRNRRHLFKTMTGREHEAADSKRFELSRIEFVMLALLYQVNFYHLVNVVDLILKYGSLYVFATIIIMELMFSMPMYMLYIFMSSYCKKSFIKFWDCVPMAAGIGYTILFIRLMYALVHITFAAVSLLYVAHVIIDPYLLTRIPHCKFDTAYACLPTSPKEPFNLSCPTKVFFFRRPNETYYISTQLFMRSVLMKFNRYSKDIIGNIDTNTVITVMCLWIIVFAVSMFGVRRMAKLSLAIQGICYCCLGFLITFAVTFASDPVVPREVPSTASFKFWIHVTQYSADTFVLSDAIWVGSMKPRSMSAKSAALLVGILRIAIILLVILCSERSMQLVRGHYKFEDPRCLIVVDHDILVSFIPDILLRFQFGVMFSIVWFLALGYTNTNVVVYIVISIVGALTERFDFLSNYRLVTYLSLCIAAFLLNIVLCSDVQIITMWTFKTYGLNLLSTVILGLTNLALLFIYSSKRIVDDYNFTYGDPPNVFWVIAWRTTPVVVMFSFIFMIVDFQSQRAMNAGELINVVISYVKAVVFLSPVIIIFLSKCCHHIKRRRLSVLTKPTDSWGPYDNIKRQTRRFFFPQRDVRYRNNVLHCPHKCIANSAKYHEESRTQTAKLYTLMQRINAENKIIDPRIKKFQDVQKRYL